MKWNYSKLRGKIKEICGTQAEFAKRLGINYATLSLKLNNVYDFTQDEIYLSVRILNINIFELNEYFFTLEV